MSRPAFAPRSTSLTLFAASVALLALAGCGRKPASGAPGGPPPADVAFLAVSPADAAVEFEYVGQVAGTREVEIRARVTGIVEKRLYDEGARVAEGQILFRIDPAPIKARVAAAEAELAEAKARLRQAERESERLTPLLEKKVVSRKDVDDALSAVDLAGAAVKAAEARAATARIDLGYTDVRAPIAGVAGRALKKEGSLASAEGDSLLTTLAQVDPVEVNFAVGEGDQLRLRRETQSGALVLPKGGFTVRLLAADGTPLPRTGRVDFQDYKVDPSTGSFGYRARVANADGVLSPGQFVKVVLTGARRPNALAVPQRAVLDGPAGKYVYVVGKGKEGGAVAEPRPIEVGEWIASGGTEKNTWVVRSGLKPGDEVIVDGTARIFFPGAPVKPSPLGAAPPASSGAAAGGAGGK